MKNAALLFFFLILTSCNFFEAKKISSEEILNEELKTFTWNEVDEYPIFDTCDSTASIQERKACFQNTLIENMSNRLFANEIDVTQPINDTILVHFEISDKGIIEITNAEIDSLLLYEIPEIENLVFQSIKSLPKIYPAIKRGQPVTTVFKLPLIITVNEN